jgi:hypothetical protein
VLLNFEFVLGRSSSRVNQPVTRFRWEEETWANRAWGAFGLGHRGTLTSFFSTLPLSHAPYEFPFLPFRYLHNGRYRNEKFEEKNTLHQISHFYLRSA